jgi:hypothetical protein
MSKSTGRQRADYVSARWTSLGELRWTKLPEPGWTSLPELSLDPDRQRVDQLGRTQVDLIARSVTHASRDVPPHGGDLLHSHRCSSRIRRTLRPTPRSSLSSDAPGAYARLGARSTRAPRVDGVGPGSSSSSIRRWAVSNPTAGKPASRSHAGLLLGGDGSGVAPPESDPAPTPHREIELPSTSLDHGSCPAIYRTEKNTVRSF